MGKPRVEGENPIALRANATRATVRSKPRVTPIRPGPDGRLDLPQGCTVEYIPDFMTRAEADGFLASTIDHNWDQRAIKMYGKTILEVRFERLLREQPLVRLHVQSCGRGS